MKIITTLLTLCISSVAHAGFETWISADGRSATMELVNVTNADGAKIGSFRMRNGKIVKLQEKDFSADDGKRLADWKDPKTPETVATPSVFDEVLKGNLLRLDGKKLKKCDDATSPAKYYVFYYTASWCGPCHAFTPSLVEWYKKNKNEKFEIVLITSDSNEKSMEGYAAEMNMPWPQLELAKAQTFKSKFNHGVSGIPSVMVCDTEGKLLGNYRGNLNGLTELVK